MPEPSLFETPAAKLNGLTEPQCLIVRTFRKILLGNRNCPALVRDFALAYGADAVEVYMTFRTLLAALAYAGRRPLSAGHPGCAWLTDDERQLLNLIAAAQAEDGDLFEANLRWLARADLRASLAMTANAFAQALRAHGQVLPVMQATPPLDDEAQLLPVRLVARLH
ncbi:MAG TPA: hypothetical protein VGF92_21710 [Stellaceae bacterium]